MQVVSNGYWSNPQEGWIYILSRNGPDSEKDVYLNEELIGSFETEDQRKDKWVGKIVTAGQTYYYSNKYPIEIDDVPTRYYSTIFRLSEQFLIRAEARAKLDKLNGSRADLNDVRARADLDALSPNDRDALLDAIAHERRVELFTEFGHRWFDLKRTQLLDETMSAITPKKGGVWNNYKSLLPIPAKSILNNPNLKGQQNPGY
ncbi:RagB/SusD family nutrient uptake outer membrane protein [Pedobacter deserti]|uniref:RagB/SusD family nutrient uptake outer membrane protein n=1 Tax=Pedobacter deserti TaxID=2817382 RepID=UPI00210A059D|nr:RagB/SusD family nutrient uptake outer membrane protein [Pedobacter sp. SYSU D00382]